MMAICRGGWVIIAETLPLVAALLTTAMIADRASATAASTSAAVGGGSELAWGSTGGLTSDSSEWAAEKSRHDSGCIQECQCHYIDDNLSAHCVRMNLVRIPEDLPPNITILDLSMNNISVLTSDAFRTSFPLLHRLDLRMNGLTEIRSGAWHGLRHLAELGLEHNELMHLRFGTFAELSSLSVLSVNNNKLAIIDNATFEGLVLKHLNLHDNNPLQALDAGLFSGARVETLSLDRCSLVSVHVDAFMPLANSLKNLFWSHNLRPLHLPARLFQGLDLATLWLSDNQMTDINFLLHTKALHLDLSSNPVGEIDLGVYVAMEHVEFFNLSRTQLKKVFISGGRIMFNLQELDVSDNFLSHIDGTLFQRMPSLTRLDVSGNQLHYIGASLHLILYQLEYWDLTGNRLLCDCRLEWFRRWASTQNKTRLLGAVCGLPRLIPVAGAPEFTCTRPTILRISSDAVQGSWHLQCDAEGWPTPRITWTYNISRHQAVRVEERWIAFHGLPLRNSSLLVISPTDARGRPPDDFCFHFVCAASNSEGHDRTEYVHCAESGGTLLPGGVMEYTQGNAGRRSGKEGEGRHDKEKGKFSLLENSSNIIASRHSGAGSAASIVAGKGSTENVAPRSSPGMSVSVGLSSAALVCLVLLGLTGALLYSRRRGERVAARPGWEPPDGTAGEGLTDSTKCLVEHNENAEKATFSMDTV